MNSATPDQSSTHGPKILVADDDADCRTSSALLLRTAGFSVVEVEDAAQALQVLAREPISLVLSDINMPGNAKLELVHEIGRLYPGLPVVLFTAFPTADTAIGSVNAGVVSYLPKPVGADKLLNAVQRAVGLYETRRAVARSLEHLRGWTEDLAGLEHQMAVARDARHVDAVGTFLDVSLRRLVASISDVRDVVEVLARTPGGAAGLRGHELEHAIKDAVAVLERTKRDFKSKELADLRQRLESLLGAPPGGKR